MEAKRKIVYVDMDNVLVDFQSGIDAMRDVITSEYDGRIDEVPHIFAHMKPLPGAVEAYRALCEKYDCYILSTSPWSNPTAASDKFAWVKKYLGDVAHKRLILSHHKNLNRGDYLIDDRPNKCGADEFEGEVIAFGSEQFPNWETVLNYLIRDHGQKRYTDEELRNISLPLSETDYQRLNNAHRSWFQIAPKELVRTYTIKNAEEEAEEAYKYDLPPLNIFD